MCVWVCVKRLSQTHLCLYISEYVKRKNYACEVESICVSESVCCSTGLMLRQRRPDTPVPRARISLTCQIGGSVALAAGPDSHRKYFLSICELGTKRLDRVGGRWLRGIYWPEGER